MIPRRPLRLARFVVATLDAIGRARLGHEGARGRAARLHATCEEIVRIHDLRVQVRGRIPAGPVVLVANHVGYLDPVAIAALTPCAPIAKAEVARWPLIGAAADQLGVLFVRRDDPWARVRALRRALATLRAGVSVLNFPEGTTTDGTRLLPFHRGAFGLARLAGVPIVPLALRCAPAMTWHGDAPFLPHYLRLAGQPTLDLRVEVGAPIDPAPGATADELAALAHHRIAHLLRGHVEPHAAIVRPRVPAPRPDALLPLAAGAGA